MSDMMVVDTKELEMYIKRLEKKGNLTAKKVVNVYVNNMAFATKKHTTETMNFKWKNSSTKKWTTNKVSVRKAPKNAGMDKQVSEIGAIGNYESNDRKQAGAGYLAKQEEGGKIRQVKSGGGSERSELLARNTKEMGSKSVRRIKDFVTIGTAKTKSRAFAAAIRKAAALKKKFISTPTGIFEIGKVEKVLHYNFRQKKAKIKKLRGAARLLYGMKKRGSISVPKHEWLKPATD